MAQGDQNDQLDRLYRLIPPQWPSDSAPLWRAILTGMASVKAWVYDAIAFVQAQTRLATASDGWLDAYAADFFGGGLPRAPSELDDPYRVRIKRELFRERATRAGMDRALTELTGAAPKIFEPARILDTGAYGHLRGYDVAGAYGSMSLPFQAFIDVERPLSVGIPGLAGYNISSGGYGSPSPLAYAEVGQALEGVTDEQIYATIEATKPVGTVAWVRINNITIGAVSQQGALTFGISIATLAINLQPLILNQRQLLVNPEI